MTAQELLKQGGHWLGAARSWIQWNCGPAGSSCTWGSDYNLGTLTPRKVEEIAAAAVAAYINSQGIVGAG